MATEIKRGQGNLFIQDDWTEEFYLLACTGVGDITAPSGDLTAKYCPDPEHSGDFMVSSKIRGEKGLVSVTLNRPLSSVYNLLLENECGGNALVTWVCEGDRSLPNRYMLAALLYNFEFSGDRVLGQPVAIQPGDNDRVETTATLNADALRMIYNMTWTRQGLSNTADANGIAFLPKKCTTDCSAERGLCEIGFMGLDGSQYNSEVKYTIDGANWTQTTTDPFAYDGGDSGKPVIYELTNAERVIVPRISMAVGEYAEVAYTEDRGVTWTNAYVGTVDSAFLRKLWKYRGVTWACGTGGYIYVSTNLGTTWTAQESGVETTQTLNDGVMYSESVGYCVGNNNVFLYTLDGGIDWAARTGPAVGANLLSVAVNSKDHVYVGASDGALYRSTDQGVTWETVQDFGVGTVPAIRFDDSLRYIGALIYNTAAPAGHVYRSINGGATWNEVTTIPTNAGLNDLWICDQNTIVVAGNAYGGTTFVAKATPVAG